MNIFFISKVHLWKIIFGEGKRNLSDDVQTWEADSQLYVETNSWDFASMEI